MQTKKIKIGRTLFLALVVLVILVLFVYQLFQLQIVRGEDILAERMEGYQTVYSVNATRGEILDAQGNALVKNRTGHNVVFDYAYLPKDSVNDTILAVSRILRDNGEEWIDSLPLTDAPPYEFLEGQDSAISRIKSRMKLQSYATADDVMAALIEAYNVPDNYTDEEIRLIAGVRNEMEERGFSMYYETNEFTFAEDISQESMIKINENFSLRGVRTVESPIREYLSGTLAPHIIGQIGPIYAEEYEKLDQDVYSFNDVIGKSGLEIAQEDILRGTKGNIMIELDAAGRTIGDEPVVLQESVPGNTIKLTLDPVLQQAAQDSLEYQINYMRENGKNTEYGTMAEAGSVVAIEVETGKVLAMATYPSYDINDYRTNYAELSSDPLMPLFNRAVSGLYAPGSCFKPMVATAGLNEGVLTSATDTVHCAHVYTFFDSYQPTCLGTHGNINVITAIQKSCNIFFYDTGRRLGIEKMGEYAALYGLGVETGIEIPENIGYMAGPEHAEDIGKDWHPGDVIQAAIGQSDSGFTTLQIANYVATVARRGVLLKPYLIDEVISYNGDEVISKTEPTVISTIDAGEGVYDAIIEGMRLASTYSGTSGSTFGAYPISVASKTGSPQRNDGLLNSTYICFAPVEDPQIAVAVVIEKGGQGYTAAPVARDIFDAYTFE